MARSDLEVIITQPLLDRLIDRDPKVRADPVASARQSKKDFEKALKRDLEWLLNTRQVPDIIPEHCSEVQRSVYAYGLPDFSAMSLSSHNDRNLLQRILEAAISKFEPRILNPRVIMDPKAGTARVLRFHIEGLMRVDPAPEHISFDTVLELTSGEYEVK